MPTTIDSSKPKVYEIHDNGGRPFFAEIKGKSVSVSKNMNTFKRVKGKFVDISAPPQHLFTITADEIFLGKKSPKGGYDGLKPSNALGNSILLKIGSRYLYIGSEIYEFSPVHGDSIVSYYSDIGNSDVPYPYAVGKTHVYIMLERVAIDKTYFDMKDDIYSQFYFSNHANYCSKFFNETLCKDKDFVKQRLQEFKDKTEKLQTKTIQKRNWH